MTAEPATWETPAETSLAADRWLILAVVLAGAFMILLDSTIVNVAIPAMQRSLDASFGAIEWVVSGYALAYGLMLIPGGRLADRFGHKRLFLIGLIGFTITSVLCGTAESPQALMGWRVAQGAMAGLMNPAVVAIIQVTFAPQERGKAFGFYGAVSGVAVALGPLLGGLLIQGNLGNLDWRPIFLLNLPIGLLTFLVAWRILRESKGRGGEIDFVGVALVATGVLLVSVPLIEGRTEGWPLWTWLSLAAAIPVFAIFTWWQAYRIRHGQTPLIDIRLFRSRTFGIGVAVGLTFFAAFIGLVFALSLYLQIGLGFTALAAGLTMLPYAVGSFVGSASSDALAQRLGSRVLLLGSALFFLGVCGLIFTLRQAGESITSWALLPSLLLSGVGSGLVIAPNVDLVLSGVPRQDAGAAGGVLSTAQRMGSALGVAVVGVAFFGALATNAAPAAEAVTPQLRSDLTAAFSSEATADAAMAEFVPCFTARAQADDPTVAIPGCEFSEPVAGDPVDAAFATAVQRAMALNFTQAMQRAALFTLGGVLLTFLLMLAMPKRKLEMEL